jgi:hypothetical protein
MSVTAVWFINNICFRFQTFKALQQTNVEKIGEILSSKKYKIILSVLIGVVISLVSYESVYISLYGSTLPPTLSKSFKTHPGMTLYM